MSLSSTPHQKRDKAKKEETGTCARTCPPSQKYLNESRNADFQHRKENVFELIWRLVKLVRPSCLQ